MERVIKGWVINDRILICGWTNPLRMDVCLSQICFSGVFWQYESIRRCGVKFIFLWSISRSNWAGHLYFPACFCFTNMEECKRSIAWNFPWWPYVARLSVIKAIKCLYCGSTQTSVVLLQTHIRASALSADTQKHNYSNRRLQMKNESFQLQRTILQQCSELIRRNCDAYSPCIVCLWCLRALLKSQSHNI